MLIITIFYKRIKEQAKIKEKSLNQVERELEYPRNALSNYKNGSHEPSGIRVLELADYFKVTPYYLLGLNDEIESLSESFEKLDLNKKLELCSICQSWLTRQLSKKKEKLPNGLSEKEDIYYLNNIMMIRKKYFWLLK